MIYFMRTGEVTYKGKNIFNSSTGISKRPGGACQTLSTVRPTIGEKRLLS
jgi:hypothetical protein